MRCRSWRCRARKPAAWRAFRKRAVRSCRRDIRRAPRARSAPATAGPRIRTGPPPDRRPP
ncbi:MAG: 50S ribosomal protein L19 [Deltaproteobacteria bacterium]|nr:MAG: 50S ribosomal protein L19 [Deltaproteobacteria bacterium]